MPNDSGCVLPDDVQERLKDLENNDAQIGDEVSGLKKDLESVSKAQEEGTALSKELQSSFGQMEADVNSLKKDLESVLNAQGKGGSLSDWQIWLIILATIFFIIYQVFIWLKINDMLLKVDKLGNKVKATEKPLLRSFVEIGSGLASILLALPTILGMLSNILGNATSSSPTKIQQEIQEVPPQEMRLLQGSSPAEGPL